jgi:hypothetical protein
MKTTNVFFLSALALAVFLWHGGIPATAAPQAMFTVNSTTEAPEQASGCTTKPKKPVLVAPPYNKTFRKVRVHLEWDGARRCATGNFVEVQDLEQGIPVDSEIYYVAGTKRTVPVEKGHTYRWRVSSCNKHGCSTGAWGLFKILP